MNSQNALTVTFEQQRLAVLVGLVSSAGSRLGDVTAMRAAAEMLDWLQAQADAAKSQPPVRDIDNKAA